MKRRPSFPEQGSMLALMETKTPLKTRRQAEPAITRLETDGEANIILMCHEPVQDPLDDPEEEAAFVAHYCGDFAHG